MSPSVAARAEPREGFLERREEPQPPPTPTVESPPPRYGPPYWYGWQINLTDVSSLGFIFAARDDRSWPLPAWLATYELGGPLVHAFHGRGWRSLASLGGRVAATALGLAAFVEIGCRDHYDPDTGEEKVTCAEAGAALLFFMYGAALADSLIDAHDRPRLPDTPVATSWTLTARRGGGTLGASWRF